MCPYELYFAGAGAGVGAGAAGLVGNVAPAGGGVGAGPPRPESTEPGPRWRQLAERWAPHAEDAFCAFNDLHAMLAFVGARRADLARRLLRAQRRRLAHGGTNEAMLRVVGLPACQALAAFGKEDYARAAQLLGGLPEVSHRLGGSHAQRGLIGLTLRAAEKNGVRPYFRIQLPAARAT